MAKKKVIPLVTMQDIRAATAMKRVIAAAAIAVPRTANLDQMETKVLGAVVAVDDVVSQASVKTIGRKVRVCTGVVAVANNDIIAIKAENGVLKVINVRVDQRGR